MLTKALAILAVIIALAVGAWSYITTQKLSQDLRNAQELVATLSNLVMPMTAPKSDTPSKELTSLQQQQQEFGNTINNIRQGVNQLQKLQGDLDQTKSILGHMQDTNTALMSKMEVATTERQRLANALKESQDRLVALERISDVKLPLSEQGDKVLVGRHRYSPRPAEERILLGLFPGLPTSLIRTKSTLDFETLHTTLVKNPKVDSFLNALTALTGAGYDVHLMVGPENPIDRPIWLEVFSESGVTILHPSLPLKTWSNIKKRTDLPDLLQNARFGVFYNQAGIRSFYELLD